MTGMLVTGAVLVGSAGRAEAAPRVLSCGAVVSSSVTLARDIGPCTGDGIDIVASGITVNLNGHTITGSNATNRTTKDQIGVHLLNVKGVTVTGPGTISKFDAGVVIDGGSGNAVKRLNVTANVAHVLLTSDGLDPVALGTVPPPGSPPGTQGGYQTALYNLPCDYGDGILVDTSSSNTLTGNTASGNGPFSGISLLNASGGNTVVRNVAKDQLVSNLEPENVLAAGQRIPGPCGPFQAGPTGQGRPNQDTGIRIEGPGATNNLVSKNQATGNQLEGISIHANVCPGNPLGIPATAPNTNNVISDNKVMKNGFADTTDGIAILQQGPANVVCTAFQNTISGNLSTGNAKDGIYVGGRGSHDNTIVRNTVNSNGRDGIYVSGPSGTGATALPGAINNTITGNNGHGNAMYDAFDGNLTPPCDNNRWTFNSFGVVNQTCIR